MPHNLLPTALTLIGQVQGERKCKSYPPDAHLHAAIEQFRGGGLEDSNMDGLLNLSFSAL